MVLKVFAQDIPVPLVAR